MQIYSVCRQSSLRGAYDEAIQLKQEQMKHPAVYIVASKRNGTLYVGVTSNLIKRVYEHKEGVIEGFTKKYGCKLLVFYESHETMISAILREKVIKGGSRKRKLILIEKMNPDWRDLYADII
ncbi:GIY-YIG nuclease family protein [Candidatus Sarmatiella mevalonica]|uniref:GIY-YIG nuclease family protein n=1 Tax=Candidatus Sarmatiella mevalonica TaxID=2770581 RepID=UPI001FC88C1E|nr:GIY-YIG nuclease family protein [Candidatus Sarmatiella mevalonica]